MEEDKHKRKQYAGRTEMVGCSRNGGLLRSLSQRQRQIVIHAWHNDCQSRQESEAWPDWLPSDWLIGRHTTGQGEVKVVFYTPGGINLFAHDIR